MTLRGDCVIFSAGALALGFLGPELSKHYRLHFADVSAKLKLLEHLSDAHSYQTNITGPTNHSLTVEEVNGYNLDDPAQSASLKKVILKAHLLITSVGLKNLTHVARFLSPIFKTRDPEQGKLVILCSENGIDVAHGFREMLIREMEEDLPDRILVGDTVMGRMCKIETDLKRFPHLVTPYPDADWAVAGEAWFGMPVDGDRLPSADLPDDVFSVSKHKRFLALEDIKLFTHNGGHSFLAYLGELKGKTFFSELADDHFVMSVIWEMLTDEVGKAILQQHREVIERNEYFNYTQGLLRRMVCPHFADRIERGTRGGLLKLGPDERLIGGGRFLIEHGIKPRRYSLAIAAAIIHNQRIGELLSDDKKIVADVCCLGDEDGELQEVVLEALSELRSHKI